MINEAIVLAGGLGTRLKGVIKDIPKPMAPINDIPFLQYLFNYLIKQGVERVVLAVGYRYEVIEDFFGSKYKSLELVYAIEYEPMGTGGGIANALQKTLNTTCFLLNGDTFFNVSLKDLYKKHESSKAQLTLSLKEMENFDRYGTVALDNNDRITLFNEKQPVTKGLINGGVYVITKSLFDDFKNTPKFSFEKDIMEAKVDQINMQAYISDGYFIDIGIPEDYKKAGVELPALFL